MFFWVHQIDGEDFIRNHIQLGSNYTIVDWKNYCMDICGVFFINNSTQIGGVCVG
jgi:hypothetical protein